MTKPKDADKRKKFPSDYNRPQALSVARAALDQGPFVQVQHGYSNGRRIFSRATIKALLEAGQAARAGSGVIARDHGPSPSSTEPTHQLRKA